MRNYKFLLPVFLVALLVIPTLAFAQDDSPAMGDSIAESCPTPANLSGTVTIGALFTLSGGASVYGTPQRYGVELAVQQINESGFLGDATLEVLFEDSASENEQAISAMTKLVEEDQVVAVIGPTLSREAFSADPIAQDNGTPVLGVSNTATGITDMGDFVFRNSLPESAVVPGVIEQANERFGFQTAALIYANDDDFTVSGYEVMLEAFEAAGVEVVAQETYATGDADFRTQLTNIIDSNPDILAISALAVEAVQIINQAHELGYDGLVMGGNGLNDPGVLTQTGAASDGLMVGAAWNIASTNPLSVDFVADYEAAYGETPNQFSAQSYTGAWLVAAGIRCADSTDRVAVRDALAGITDFDTPLGTYSFDEDRNPIHAPVVQVGQDGAFSVLGADDE